MTPISIFGTSSDAGKSTLTFVIAKIIQNAGYSVAPFKAQNVSNNSHVADDGSEIAIAQFFQAEVLGVPTSYHLNPVLLKSGRGNSASMIVNGKVAGEKEVREYYRDLDTLKPAVDASFEYLSSRYDCVVCEGAGSPVELNLMDKDLSNIYIAERFNTKIILVADIERGGVFASIWGVYNLLPDELKKKLPPFGVHTMDPASQAYLREYDLVDSLKLMAAVPGPDRPGRERHFSPYGQRRSPDGGPD